MNSSAPIATGIYKSETVKNLFDEMSGTYGFVNLIASLGFTIIWRKVVVSRLPPGPAPLVVVDLMCGMGELFPELRVRFPGIRRLIGLDFSSKMCERAREQARRNSFPTEILEEDVFDHTIPVGCADTVVSSFGLKTFSMDQQAALAVEVERLLKPGGRFSFIEISTPTNSILKIIYMFYLIVLIPLIGRFCLGNPDNYRFLSVYTRNFGDSRFFRDRLSERGLEAEYFEHFFGCATGVRGRKPT